MTVDLRRHKSVAAVHRVMALQNEGMYALRSNFSVKKMFTSGTLLVLSTFALRSALRSYWRLGSWSTADGRGTYASRNRLNWWNPSPAHPDANAGARSGAAQPTRMAPVLERRAAKPPARPARVVAKGRVTKKQMTTFRSNPYLLRGKRFVSRRSGHATRVSPSDPHGALSYKVVGLLFSGDEEHMLVDYEDGRAPEELPMDVAMDMLEQ